GRLVRRGHEPDRPLVQRRPVERDAAGHRLPVEAVTAGAAGDAPEHQERGGHRPTPRRPSSRSPHDVHEKIPSKNGDCLGVTEDASTARNVGPPTGGRPGRRSAPRGATDRSRAGGDAIVRRDSTCNDTKLCAVSDDCERGGTENESSHSKGEAGRGVKKK